MMLKGRKESTSESAPRFRILIIGNANAGKTTILKNVCCGNVGDYIYITMSH
jgi:GTPase SAR1 family protein